MIDTLARLEAEQTDLTIDTGREARIKELKTKLARRDAYIDELLDTLRHIELKVQSMFTPKKPSRKENL